MNATGGSVTKSPDNASYSFNDRVALTAISDSVHAFDHWSGDAAGTANPCTVTVDGNKAVTANFVQLYTVVFNGNGNDSGIVPINAKKYKSSDTVTMPGQGTLKKTGYAFAGEHRAGRKRDIICVRGDADDWRGQCDALRKVDGQYVYHNF